MNTNISLLSVKTCNVHYGPFLNWSLPSPTPTGLKAQFSFFNAMYWNCLVMLTQIWKWPISQSVWSTNEQVGVIKLTKSRVASYIISLVKQRTENYQNLNNKSQNVWRVNEQVRIIKVPSNQANKKMIRKIHSYLVYASVALSVLHFELLRLHIKIALFDAESLIAVPSLN